jgi:hypothetical protein
MKKLIPLILLTGVVFFFSSCDAMLESIYPDQTGQGGGDNSIYVTVDVNALLFPDYNYHNVCFELYMSDDNGSSYNLYQSLQTYLYYASSTTAEGSASFSFLPDGSYYVVAWYDQVSDGTFSTNEDGDSTISYDLAGGDSQDVTIAIP